MENQDRIRQIGKCVVAVLVFMTVSSAYGQKAPTLRLSANKTTGDPGDKITFTWKIDDQGNPIRRVTLRIDGEPVSWKNPHTWTATPGTHVIHAEARWGKADDYPYTIADVKLEISGGEGHFNHPGIYNSQEELAVSIVDGIMFG